MIECDDGWGPCVSENVYLQRVVTRGVKCVRSKVQKVLYCNPIKASHAASISTEKKQTQKILYF